MTASQEASVALLPRHTDGQRLCRIFGRYRWCAIEASVPDDLSQKPQWRTLTGYPIRPRVLWARWQDASTLIGVRFDHTTTYALLDIDVGSQYHSPEDIANIREALETLGITRTVLIQSSWSQGLHLYIPLPEAVNTFNLAVALAGCLASHGMKVQDGQLEIYPNIKAYGLNIPIEYKAHRLPLQPASGSCILDDDFNPISDYLADFFTRWDQATAAQDMLLLQEGLVAGRNQRRQHPQQRLPRWVSTVEAWQRDLDLEIQEGWTAPGQTNHLLKTIACQGVVFLGLSGDELTNHVVETALNCPGYRQYCRHQHHIQQRARSWARAAEHYYWPLGSRPHDRSKPSGPHPNQARAESARTRIQQAVTELTRLGQLPKTVRARVQTLTQRAQTSAQTLYKYLALWHPEHYSDPQAPPPRSPLEINQVEAPSPNTQQAVTDRPVKHSVAQTWCDHPPAQQKSSSECPQIQGVTRKKEKMKSSSPDKGEDNGSVPSFPPNRGVRGDGPHIPQPVDREHFSFLDEFAYCCRRQVQRLGWNGVQLVQFIANRFNGKRRAELSDNELISLLYQLQSLEREH